MNHPYFDIWEACVPSLGITRGAPFCYGLRAIDASTASTAIRIKSRPVRFNAGVIYADDISTLVPAGFLPIRFLDENHTGAVQSLVAFVDQAWRDTNLHPSLRTLTAGFAMTTTMGIAIGLLPAPHEMQRFMEILTSADDLPVAPMSSINMDLYNYNASQVPTG